MSIKSRVESIVNALNPFVLEKKLSEPKEVFDEEEYSGVGRGKEPEVVNDDLVEVYSTYTWVYVAVNVIARSGASVPIKVYKKKSKGKEATDSPGEFEWEEAPDSSLAKLFERPNPYFSWYELLEGTYAYLEMLGNAYWEVVKAKKKSAQAGIDVTVPVEVYLLKSQNMRPIPDPKTLVKGYELLTNGKSVNFKPDEIIAFKYFNPKSTCLGMAPMQPATNSVTMDLWSIGYNKDFFKNSARPEGVLFTPNKLSTTTWRRMQRYWDRMFKGPGRQHRTQILEEGLEYKPITVSPKDTEFVNQRKMSREEILAIFGVPPIKAGLLDNAYYATSREQNKAFWGETMLPKITKIENAINASLVRPYFGEDYYAEFDRDSIVALKEEEEKTSNVLRGYVAAGLMTINEAREKMGLKAVDGGDVVLVNPGLIPLDQMEEMLAGGMVPGAPPVDKPKEGDEPKKNPDEKLEEDGDGEEEPKSDEDTSGGKKVVLPRKEQ